MGNPRPDEPTTPDSALASREPEGGHDRPRAAAYDRRQALAAGALLAVGGAALASCSSSGSTGGTTAATTTVPAGDVPVGGGTILTEPPVVVTQPTAGEYHAFSSICPHQFCPVTGIEGDQIVCACHGSRFALATGAVVQGPATSGLQAKKVEVSGPDLRIS